MAGEDDLDLDPDIFGLDALDLPDSSDADGILAGCALAMFYRAPENTSMKWHVRLLDFGRLARYDDEKLVENFRFELEYLQVFHTHLRLPAQLHVNGHHYSKLEGILCLLWRGATAAQGKKAEDMFGLDRRRLSELKCWMVERLQADHCRVLRTLEPWHAQLDYFVECVARQRLDRRLERQTYSCFGMVISMKSAGHPSATQTLAG